MNDTATLAGYFAAHAVWSVSEGETMIPLLAFEKFNGTREMARLENPDAGEAVKAGHEWLRSNPDAALRAVLIFDGYVTRESGERTDGLIVEARLYGSEPRSFTMTIPYRNAKHEKGLLVYRPSVEQLSDVQTSVADLSRAFFRGVNQHRQAAPVWARHFNPEA